MNSTTIFIGPALSLGQENFGDAIEFCEETTLYAMRSNGIFLLPNRRMKTLCISGDAKRFCTQNEPIDASAIEAAIMEFERQFADEIQRARLKYPQAKTGFFFIVEVEE